MTQGATSNKGRDLEPVRLRSCQSLAKQTQANVYTHTTTILYNSTTAYVMQTFQDASRRIKFPEIWRCPYLANTVGTSPVPISYWLAQSEPWIWRNMSCWLQRYVEIYIYIYIRLFKLNIHTLSYLYIYVHISFFWRIATLHEKWTSKTWGTISAVQSLAKSRGGVEGVTETDLSRQRVKAPSSFCRVCSFCFKDLGGTIPHHLKPSCGCQMVNRMTRHTDLGLACWKDIKQCHFTFQSSGNFSSWIREKLLGIF